MRGKAGVWTDYHITHPNTKSFLQAEVQRKNYYSYCAIETTCSRNPTFDAFDVHMWFSRSVYCHSILKARAHHRLVSVSPPGPPSVHIQLSPGLPTPPSRLGCDFSFSVRATRAASWLQGHPLSPMMDLKGLRVWRDSRLSILSEPFNLDQHIKQMPRQRSLGCMSDTCPAFPNEPSLSLIRETPAVTTTEDHRRAAAHVPCCTDHI